MDELEGIKGALQWMLDMISQVESDMKLSGCGFYSTQIACMVAYAVLIFFGMTNRDDLELIPILTSLSVNVLFAQVLSLKNRSKERHMHLLMQKNSEKVIKLKEWGVLRNLTVDDSIGSAKARVKSALSHCDKKIDKIRQKYIDCLRPPLPLKTRVLSFLALPSLAVLVVAKPEYYDLALVLLLFLQQKWPKSMASTLQVEPSRPSLGN